MAKSKQISMQIKLKKLIIRNFKGIEFKEIDFNENETFIFGRNASGKTSVIDAFMWLMFGKNSENESKFNIKRLDESGNFIERAQTEVEAHVMFGDIEEHLRKELIQKWTKRRGSQSEEYTGDVNNYYWNDVPLRESDFKTKIENLINENIFRLISNPLHFNQNLSWQERREMLLKMCGKIDNAEIVYQLMNDDESTNYDELLDAFKKRKSIEEFKSEISAKKSKLTKDLEQYNPRIDELRRSIETTNTTIDAEELQNQLKQVDEQISAVVAEQSEFKKRFQSLKESNDQKIQAETNAVNALKNKLFSISQQIGDIKRKAQLHSKEFSRELNDQISKLQNKLSSCEQNEKMLRHAIDSDEKQLETMNANQNDLRAKYDQLENSVYVPLSDNEINCKCCGQRLPDENILILNQNNEKKFNEEKVKQLNQMIATGKSNNAAIEMKESVIKTNRDKLSELLLECSTAKVQLDALLIQQKEQPSEQSLYDGYLAASTEFAQLMNEATEIQDAINNRPAIELNEIVQDSELMNKLNDLQKQKNEINLKIGGLSAIEQNKKRIEELKKEQKQKADDLTKLEGVEYSILQFTKKQVEYVERMVSSAFKTVRFKMFEQQVNGGEKPTCVTMVNSNGSFVPFSDANNAAKINAGIDIINGLSEYFNFSAPIFIDNRESVTEIFHTQSQVINFVVSADDKHLRIG